MTKLIVIAGPSASGKTTVADKLVRENEGFRYTRSVSTRKERNDAYKNEYIYLDREEFKRMVESREILEYTEYLGELYGTPVSEIERIRKEGAVPLLVLDLNGVLSLKEKGADLDVKSVYMYDELPVLERRLYERAVAEGLTPEALTAFEKRKARNEKELSRLSENRKLFDLVIRNTDIDKTVEEIKKL